MSAIPPDKALNMLNAGALLIDVRSHGEYRSLHAKDARCVPLDTLQKKVDEVEPLIEPYSNILLTCQSGNRAKTAYDILSKRFNKNFFIIEGGTNAWVENDLPVIKGKGTITIERQVRICAGSIILIGSLLAIFISKWFILIPAFVGAGLLNAGITEWCGMGLLLAKMPWNK